MNHEHERAPHEPLWSEHVLLMGYMGAHPPTEDPGSPNQGGTVQTQHRLDSLCSVAASKCGEGSPGIDGNTMGQMDMEHTHGVVGGGQPHGKDRHGEKPQPGWA